MQWIAQGAVDSMVTQYYAPDAVFLNLNQPAAVGTDAIRKTINGFLAMGNFRFQLKTVSLQAMDSLASEYGTYTLELRPKPPADTTKVVMTDHGNYVTTFVRRNGQCARSTTFPSAMFRLRLRHRGPRRKRHAPLYLGIIADPCFGYLAPFGKHPKCQPIVSTAIS